MEMNIKNLEIARDVILGLDPEMLDMGCFYDEWEIFNNCGSIGCIVGWSDESGLLPKREKDEYYKEWSERVFGIIYPSILWCYLFSPKWDYWDNTIEGAVQRLTNIIENPNYEFTLPWLILE